MDEFYSTSLKRGSRTFYFDIQEGKNKSIYLTVTERKIVNGKSESQQINIYEGDLARFMETIESTAKHFLELQSGLADINIQSEIAAKPSFAYIPWTEEADAKLQSLYHSGTKIRVLAEIFGRSSGAIHSRLGKLGLT